MHVVMIGTGYVGLVSGACFADFGHQVTCIDKDAGKIEGLKAGRMPIFEPGLDTLVARNVQAGRLAFTTEAAEAVRGADAVFIAVGTPSRRGDGHADLSYVHAAAAEIADLIEGFTVVVTKSTVPVGTGDEIERIIRERRPDAAFAVVSNPEFLREGAAIDDFKRPDRVVVGLNDERARPVMTELYRPLFLNETPIQFTERRTSELIKYAGNAFLAMKITFINEMADLCEAVGADVQQVAKGIGLDKRIGGKFLNAGPGYGGSCFPKDTLALVRTATDAGSPVRLIETTVAVNDARKKAMAAKVAAAVGNVIDGGALEVVVLAVEVGPLTAPQLAHEFDRLAQPGETLLEVRPLAGEPGGNLVERLAGAHAEEHPARVQAAHGGERLGHHGGVVPEGGREHGRAQGDPLRPFADGRQPRQRERRVPTLMPPRLEVIADRRAVHSVFLGEHAELDKFTGPELLGRRLVSQLQVRHGLVLPH